MNRQLNLGAFSRTFILLSFSNKKSIPFFFSLALLLLFQTGHAQSLIWAKGFGDPSSLGGKIVGTGIKADAAGNTYVTGYFYATADLDPGTGIANVTSIGGADIFIAKYDVSGNYVWAKSIGGTADDDSSSITIDGSGNVYVTGYFRGTADFDPGTGTANLTSAGGADIFLAKYDGSGNYLWAKNMGGAADDISTGIVVDASSHIYITGSFNGSGDFDAGAGTANLTSTGGTDIFLSAYDGAGNYLWAKNMGGTGTDSALAVSLDASGNIYITGSFSGTADLDGDAPAVSYTSVGNADIFWAKYDVSGTFAWAKTIGGTGDDIGRGINVDIAGNVFLTGSFSGTVDFDAGVGTANYSSYGGTDFYLAKYDASGNYAGAVTAGDTGDDFGRSITSDAGGNIYMIVTYSSNNNDIEIIKFDVTGNPEWINDITGAGDDNGNCITVDGNGNSYSTGYFSGTTSFFGGGTLTNATLTNAFVAKQKSDGSYGWASQLGRYETVVSSVATGKKVALDGSGNVYVTGYFNGSVDLDAGPGTATFTSAGSNDIFIAKYDGNGNYLWGKQIGGSGADAGIAIAVDATGNAYVTGTFNGIVDFDAGTGTANQGLSGWFSTFLTKYDAAGNFVWAKGFSPVTSGNSLPYGIAIDGSGNVFVTGSLSGTVDFDASAATANLTSNGSFDVFFVRYDAAGNFGWANRIGGTGLENVSGITTDASGNVYISGAFNGTVDFDAGAGSATLTSNGGSDIFITRYDASGNYTWAKNIGNPGTDNSLGIATDQTNYLYITGYYYGTVDFDPGASVSSLTASGGSDVYVAKYDLSGNYVWSKSMGGSGNDVSSNITVNGNGDVYISGYFAGTADFDPSTATANVTASGTSDYFLARYNASGNYIAAKSMEATTVKNISGLVVDAGGNVFTTGYFKGTVDFDPDAPVYNLVSMNSSSDIFLAKYNLAATPLPVTLLDFDAKSQQSNVHVTFTTTEELNNNYFEVLRSNDGVHFETIGKVNGCGNCSAGMQYSFDDGHPYAGTSYYRLKQVDNNGGYSLSKIVTVKFSNQTIADVSMYPNPANGHFLLKIQNSGNSRQIQVSISNASGYVVQQLHPVIVQTENKIPVDLSKQPAGIYFIQVIDAVGGEPTTLKVIKY
ncbi:hypothetical protein A3860_33880 [Niastella vici]|uniref:Secretion system C-terminal sorting domain-containing protein n=1 Tax=Niastella vici TaxID=1703345 RepID=A0A1V9FPV7_9BACT|nr:SBBP repeat-containing protein [Niastella vici]OQP60372.1 hypothetical protein A3860_33880 [Niastella vici]